MTYLDAFKAQWPDWGCAVYALSLDGIVTLEVHAPTGEILSSRGASEAEAWESLFPGLLAPAAAPPPPDEPEDNVFD